MQDKHTPLAPTRHRWVIPVIWAYILAWFLLGLWAVYSQIFLLQFATC